MAKSNAVTTGLIMGFLGVYAFAGEPPRESSKSKSDVQSLLLAAQQGDLERVNKAIADGVNVNGRSADMSKWTALHAAAERSQLEILKRLIQAGANVNVKNYLDVTPLHWAAIRGPVEAVTVLLSAGADPNAYCVQHDTPLGAAAGAGKVDIVRALIGAGADVNGGKSMTPLVLAAKYGRVDVIGVLVKNGAKLNGGKRPPLHWAGKPETVRALLAVGADVNTRDSAGRTALHLTTGYWVPNAAAVEALITAGADVNAKSKKGVTPLHAALRHKKLAIVELLISAGADVDAADDAGHTPLSLARQAGKPFLDVLAAAAAKNDGMTELLRAVKKGDEPTVNHLIKEGVDVNVPGPGGMSAVQLASKLGNAEILNSLIAAGAKVDVQDENGLTPLHVAANASVAEQLIAAGAKVDVRAKYETPIFRAVSQGRVDVVRSLIRHGALKNTDKDDLFVLAAFYGRSEVIKELLKNGVKVDSRISFCRESALDVLARGGLADMQCPDHVTPELRLEISRQLITAGADVNATTDIGYFRDSTALYGAASSGHLGLVKLLLDNGAKVNVRSPEGSFAGETPLHGAARGGHAEVVELLIKSEANINAVTGESHFNGRQTPLDVAKTQEVLTLLVKHGGKPAADIGG